MRIPFRFFPGSWGLRGKTYEIAKAEYELEGEALERRLIEINHAGDKKSLSEAMLACDLRLGKITPLDYDLLCMSPDASEEDILAVKLRHGKITQYDHDREVALLRHPEGEDREIALLDVEFQHGKLSKIEHEKRVATVRDEPWVGIVSQDFDVQQGVDGLKFEFDWNDQWIEYLRLNGYTGNSPERIVEQWFNHLCRSVAEEQFREELEAIDRAPGRVINRVLGIGGGTEFS